MVTVYLIRSESLYGEVCYKIGITRRSVAKRLKELQTGNPNVLEVVTCYESKYGTLLESVLHRSYPHVHNEWFELTDEQVADFTETCRKCEANLQVLEQNSYWNRHNSGFKVDDEW